MARESIGEIDCALCGRPSDVRKNVKNKLYWYCENCGMMQPNLPGGQDAILERATIYGPGGKPEPLKSNPQSEDEATPSEPAEISPGFLKEEKPKEKPKRGFLSGFFDDLPEL